MTKRQKHTREDLDVGHLRWLLDNDILQDTPLHQDFGSVREYIKGAEKKTESKRGAREAARNHVREVFKKCGRPRGTKTLGPVDNSGYGQPEWPRTCAWPPTHSRSWTS